MMGLRGSAWRGLSTRQVITTISLVLLAAVVLWLLRSPNPWKNLILGNGAHYFIGLLIGVAVLVSIVSVQRL